MEWGKVPQHHHPAKVMAIYDGIEIVSAAGVLKNRTVTTVSKCALDCAQGGGKYVDRNFF